MSHKSRSFASSKNESPSSFARLEPLATNANGPSIVSTAAVSDPCAAAFRRDAKSSRPRGAAQSALGPFPLAAPVSGARPARDRPARSDASRVGTVSSETRVSRGSAFASCPVCGASGGPPTMATTSMGPGGGAPSAPPRPRPAPAPSLPGRPPSPISSPRREAELLAFVDGSEASESGDLNLQRKTSR